MITIHRQNDKLSHGGIKTDKSDKDIIYTYIVMWLYSEYMVNK
jgi:hypothetical protein